MSRRNETNITVQGVVQGVGFRPFVYGLASRLGLSGTVRNDATGVAIDVEGEPASLQAFLHALIAEAPPLARIEWVAAEGSRSDITPPSRSSRARPKTRRTSSFPLMSPPAPNASRSCSTLVIDATITPFSIAPTAVPALR